MRFISAHVLWNLSDRFTAAKRYEIEFPWGERVVMSQRAKEMLETLAKTIDAQMETNSKLASLCAERARKLNAQQSPGIAQDARTPANPRPNTGAGVNVDSGAFAAFGRGIVRLFGPFIRVGKRESKEV